MVLSLFILRDRSHITIRLSILGRFLKPPPPSVIKFTLVLFVTITCSVIIWKTPLSPSWLRNTNMWTIPKYSFSFTYFVSRYMPFLVVVCVHSVTVVRGFIGQNFSSSPLKKSFHHLVLLWKSGRYNNSNLIQIDYNFVWNATERFILSFIVMTDDFW